MENVLIMPRTGNGIEIVDVICDMNEHDGEFNILGFLDDKADPDYEYRGYKIIGGLSSITDYPDAGIVLGMFDPK